MRGTLLFAKRNIKNFFKDKTAVFFSLLSVIIIIGLYVLFLGELVVGGLPFENARLISDSWIMAGVISVTSVTTAMGAFEAIVKDGESGSIKDFYASPINKSQITIGYVLSAIVVGVIMTLLSLVFAQVYILAYGGKFLSVIAYLKIFGVILLSVMANGFFVFFIVSFIKSNTAFATASTILGTLIGFLTGVYIPIGQLPEAVRHVVKVFPASHSAALLRQIMMEDALAEAFAGAGANALNNYKLEMGVNFQIGDLTLAPWHSIVFIAVMGAVFFVFSAIKISKKFK
jgi:multidrug/hemolysin transport system permease protein